MTADSADFPEYIYLTGPDGAGKTYHSKQIHRSLQSEGAEYERVWLRFYHFFSLLLLGFARVAGYTDVVTTETGEQFSVHNFEDSALLSRLYPPVLFFDTALYIVYRRITLVHSSPDGVIFDRFVYDTICQAMTSTGRSDIPNTVSARLFGRLLPERTGVVLLLADTETLRERRADVSEDPKLAQKKNYFELLAEQFDVPVVDTGQPKSDTQQAIRDVLTRQ